MSKYITNDGYFNASPLFENDTPFIFVLGGRGIGKTYSATKWLCDNADENHKFIFMRRTQAEMDFINTGNIYAEHSPEIELDKLKSKYMSVIKNDQIIGYHMALSSINKIRGFSMLDVSYILFDEFIPERGTVSRRFMGEQMLNAYETINRNRELKGEKPVKCIFLSNYNTAMSDIMLSFGFEDELYKMKDSHPLGIYKDEAKMLLMINDSDISEKKRATALYKATKNNKEFTDMAIENNGEIEQIPVRHYGRKSYEYLGTLGKININRLYTGEYYLTESNAPNDTITLQDKRKWAKVIFAYNVGRLYSSSNYISDLFLDIYDTF